MEPKPGLQKKQLQQRGPNRGEKTADVQNVTMIAMHKTRECLELLDKPQHLEQGREKVKEIIELYLRKESTDSGTD